MRHLITLATFLLTTIAYSQSPQTADSLIIKDLISKVNDLKSSAENNSKNITILYANKELDAKSKYELIKDNLINATETFTFLNGRINDLKSRNTSNKYDLLVKELNNPQSDILGFKFNDIVLNLVNVHIQPKKEKGKRLLDVVDGIMQSPIVKSITGLTPALSVANSVLSVFRSTSITNDQVDVTKINNFENALNKYVQYYVALNEANQSFNFNLDHQKEELGLLQQKLYDQTMFFTSTLKFQYQTKSPNETTGQYLNNLLSGFDKNYMNQLFADIELKNTSAADKKIQYEEILKNNQFLKDANNKLEEFIALVTQFEFQHNEYFNILELYNNKISIALDLAINNAIGDKSKIDAKKIEFTTLKNETITDIKTAINIQGLNVSKRKIKYTARVI